MRKTHLLATTVLAVTGFSSFVFAQTPPDAGRTLQELTSPTLEMPKDAPPLNLQVPQSTPPKSGGAKTSILSLVIRGNSLFDEETLREVAGDLSNQAMDLGDMRQVARRISDYYHDEGYPFARAAIPPQEIKDGVLIIEVMEGRYGQIKADGEPDVAEAAQDFLSTLEPGTVIESGDLERSTLILGDQPGVKASPIIRPGQEMGTGDLNVPVKLETAVHGDVGGDNYGNRYSGEYRARANLDIDSPFLFGDQIQIKSLGSDEAMWLGSLSYSLPLGSSGLRGQLGYYQTDYNLGKQFANLDAKGYAKVSSAGLSYPLIRSQKVNVSTGLSYQHKDLMDKQGASNTSNTKKSESLPLSVQFDRRDTFGGGGITYGVLSWTHGWLHLDSSLESTDMTTAKTEGAFNKLNVDVARLQKLPEDFLFFARFSGQWATENLDSSEGFGLGGSNGVRAYPSGEAYGDEGWLAQVEVRYAIDAFTPFVFYDAGRVTINTNPWDTAKNNRSVSGPGFGVRFTYEGWNADATLAWRTQGGKPESDTMDRSPRLWMSAGYRF